MKIRTRLTARSMVFGLKKLSRLFVDSEHSEQEERFVLIACNSANNLLVVVHCYREAESVIRIISVRKASKKERAFYEEGL